MRARLRELQGRAFGCAFGVCALLACKPATTPEITVVPELMAPAAAVAPSDAGTPKAPRCTFALQAGAVQKLPSCMVDEKVGEKSATLTVPCEGDGAARAEFGASVFKGAVINGGVLLELESEYDWEDGCTWHTSQRIQGRLDQPDWTYAYREKVISGKDCGGSCVATAKITFTR
jgi:hypothetical protein